MSKLDTFFKLNLNENKTPIKNKEDQSIGSTTNYDSLHNIKNILIKNFNSENKLNEKNNNFFLALKSLRESVDNLNLDEKKFFEGINEYSETNPNQTKEENVSKYIHRPLVKEIIKDGNNLNVIKPLTQFGTSINNPYIFKYNLGDIIHKFKTNNNDNYNIKNEQKNNLNTKININKPLNINTEAIDNKYKKYFNTQKNLIEIKTINNKFKDGYLNISNIINLDEKSNGKYNIYSTILKPSYSIKIIDDLEKSVDIKVKDYKNKMNIIKNNQKFKNEKNNNNIKINQLKTIVKNLNFENISKDSKTEEKSKNKTYVSNEDNKCATVIKKMIIPKISISTGEKIRKKYERSELKKSQVLKANTNLKNKNILIDLKYNNLDENKENINTNNINFNNINTNNINSNNINNKSNIELTKKIIKNINKMTTVKADYYKKDKETFDINNFFINNICKRNNLQSSTISEKDVARNLLNKFNSCSKKLSFDNSSINQSIQNIDNFSLQKIKDLFSNKSGFVDSEINENDKTIIVKETDTKLNILKDFSFLLESNINTDKNINFNSLIKSTIKRDINFFGPNNTSSKGKYQKNNNSIKDNEENKIIYKSPDCKNIRNFDLDSPFNTFLFYTEFNLFNLPQNLTSDIKLNNKNRSKKFIDKIIKYQFKDDIFDLSESKSNINNQSPKNINKPLLNIEENNNSVKLSDNNFNNYMLKSEMNSQNKSYISSKFDESKCQYNIYDMSFYLNLTTQSNSYSIINPIKLFKKNPTIKWDDRLKILLWMMKNCEEFAYKRDTFHYSIFYFDLFLYLSKEEIKKDDLKLIGITCISLSAKIEEVQIPKLIEYSKSIDPKCEDINIIISMEQKICSALKWKLIPITIEIWLNWYTCQWDLFMDTFTEIRDGLLEYITEEEFLYFKKQNEKAYCNYRRIYLLIDLISLDYNNYNYDKRGLVAACFFESICYIYNLEYSFNKKILFSKTKERKQGFIDIIQKMYNLFVEQSFDYYFSDQLVQNCIKYVFKFKEFSFSYNMPLIYRAQQNKDEDIEYNYEDFISYQTTNSDIFPFFEKIYKFKSKKNKINEKKKYMDNNEKKD